MQAGTTRKRTTSGAGKKINAQKVATDHRNNALNPYITREPALFGKARWQQTHDALMATDRQNIARYECMKRCEFTPAKLALADQEAERRAGEKQPKLAELGKGAHQQIREAVSRGAKESSFSASWSRTGAAAAQPSGARADPLGWIRFSPHGEKRISAP